MADQATGRLSPFLRRRRTRAAYPYLVGRILDYGCGVGSLVESLDPTSYVGVDQDAESIEQARQNYPTAEFFSTAEFDEDSGCFNTVVSLAVIEHVSDPVRFLTTLARYLGDEREDRIVITTPHPNLEWVHHTGANIGLFSADAEEEHESLLDRKELAESALSAGLRVARYKRFLLGANQLAVMNRVNS